MLNFFPLDILKHEISKLNIKHKYDFRIKHILINFTKINIPHMIYTKPI